MGDLSSIVVAPAVQNFADMVVHRFSNLGTEHLKKLMTEYHVIIEMGDSSDLVIHGGSLNCCTWTVFEK